MLSTKQKQFYTILFPTVIEGIFNQLFSIVDSVMIGHIKDSTVAVAAVSLCSAPLNLVICVTSAFFIGTTAVVAWYFGAQDTEKMNETARQSLVLAFLAGTIVTIISFMFSHNIIGFVCGGNEAYSTAASYYKINSAGFFFQVCSICITASFRGKGITKIPMLYNIFGNGLNVIFNYVLIYGKLGFSPMYVKGAAIATVCSKIIVFVIALSVFIFGRNGFSFSKKDFSLKLAPQVTNKMLKIGLTSACEQLVLQSGATITAKIISLLPTSQIAALQITSNLEALAWSSGDACCTATTSLFGKSLGEKNPEKARSFLKLAEIWAIIFSVAEIILFCSGGKFICRIFTNDTSIYGDISHLLIIAAVGLPFINTHKTVSGALRGAGDSVAPLISSLISLWIFRVLLGYILISVFHLGTVAYRWCLNIDQFVRMFSMLIFYFTGHWKKYLK